MTDTQSHETGLTAQAPQPADPHPAGDVPAAQDSAHPPVTGKPPAETDKQKEYRITQQFKDWLEYFLDKGNPKTYGNKTQSAIAAYQLDPVRQYATAGHIGWENYRKAQSLGSAYLESQGITAGKMLDVAVAKMLSAKGGGGKDWWDRIAEITGMVQPKNEPPAGGGNTQINVFNLHSEEVLTFNERFQKFLESQ